MIEFINDIERSQSELASQSKTKQTSDQLLISTRQLVESFFLSDEYRDKMTSLRRAPWLVSPIDNLQEIEPEYMGHVWTNNSSNVLLWMRNIWLKWGKVLSNWIQTDAEARKLEHKFDPKRHEQETRSLVNDVENRLARTGLMIKWILYTFDPNNGKFYTEQWGQPFDAFDYATTGERDEAGKKSLDLYSQMTHEQWARAFPSDTFDWFIGEKFEDTRIFLTAIQRLPKPIQWSILRSMQDKKEKNTVAQSAIEGVVEYDGLKTLLSTHYSDIRADHVATS
jgi:hypothetical protein